MAIYPIVLAYNIENEKNGIGHVYGENDKKILAAMTRDINKHLGTDIHYLTEIHMFNLQGAGSIMLNYIHQFESESVKAYLIPQLVTDRVPNCSEIILDLYKGFKSSNKYISAPGESAPVHIAMSYDYAFTKLKPKKYRKELMNYMIEPRDIFYLPLTARMIASWKKPEMYERMLKLYESYSITDNELGLEEGVEGYAPPAEFIRRELKFTAIDCLKYYPTEEVVEMLVKLLDHSDKHFRNAANKSLKYIEKHKKGG